MADNVALQAFQFFSPQKIVFGWRKRAELSQCAQPLGRRAWLVCGSRTLEQQGVVNEIRDQLRSVGIASEVIATIRREPEVRDVDETTSRLTEAGVREGDFVLAVGGGAAIDLGKAVAAMAANRQSPTVRDYLEGVGRGLKIVQPPLPIMAVPSTAGTGSEATKNAVISCDDPPFKKSLRSDLMVPKVVLVDPELTVSVPPETTAHTGMDAITQLIESYLSRRAQPIPQALALKGLEGTGPAIVEAVENGTSRKARERMALAALLSGMALANSGLGMAHGVAAALGVHARVPHGLACAVMLPVAMRVNRPVRRVEMARLGTLFTGEPWSARLTSADQDRLADAAVTHIVELCRRLKIPQRLSDLNVTADQLPAIVSSSRGNSMNGNPRQLSDEELLQILEEML
ncbi:MAG TPA: iron-containing alcohol dehydrogenase [Planctomycetaceae bacterium]|nr:iron-containing alcohol dehydrogenase [Planctomycetaceae bacterium]